MRRWTLIALLGTWLLIAPITGLPAEPPSAQADPDATLVATAGELTLSWAQLGLPRGVDFPTVNVNQDFAVPLPTGFRPSRLRGLIHAPVNIAGGYLEIDDDRGLFLGAVSLPSAQTPDQVVVPFDVDIAAARIGNSTVGLSFTVRQNSAQYQNCGPQQTLSITDLATVFAGAEPAPTSIATFFPSVLQRVALYAPADADGAEQQAVLALAAALTRLYRPQTVAITVGEQPRGATPPPAGPMARAVLVERGTAGLDIVGAGTPEALLRVSGRDDQLTAQVSMLINQVQELAQATRARVDQAGSRRGTTDTWSFDQLQMTGKADVLRTATLTVGADRAALSDSRIDSIRVHLLADYTPVAKEDNATVMVRAGNTVVFSSALNDSGRLDATFDLPAQILTERIVLNFALTYTPRMICSPMIAPITFQLDPRSTLTAHRGGRAVGGFRSLPSEFSPNFVVALDGSGPGQLSYAARLVVDMARVTSADLTPRVVDLKSAVESKLGALIVANSTTLKQTTLNPPVSGDQSSISLDLPTALRADIGSGLGSIQAFADPPRDRTVVLVTTTAAWPLVDPLLGYIEQLPDGWSQLTGDTLAAGAQGIPAVMSIRDTRIGPAPSPGSWTPPLSVVFGIVGAFVLGVFATWLWLRRRRDQFPAGNGD